MIRFLKLSVFLSILGAVLIQTSSVSALAFVPNNLMDSATFDNSGSMNEAQIDAFLNQFASSCISSNNSFTAPDVKGYNPDPNIGFTYNGNVSAGKVIGHAAEAYGINPQVLLSTLQKEQGLVTGGVGCHPEYQGDAPQFYSWSQHSACIAVGNPYSDCAPVTCGNNTTYSNCSYACKYSGGCIQVAVGYDCPGFCKKSSAGFSPQIIKAAWSLKFHEQRAIGNVGWDVQKTTTVDASGNAWVSAWDDSDDPPTHYTSFMTQGTFSLYQGGPAVPFDGFGTVKDLSNSSVSVHMDTGPTAALYAYTPFESGNQSFVNIFTGWFGNTFGPGYDYVTATSPTVQILPNDVQSVQIQIRNRSGLTWYSDGNVPAGQQPLRLMLMGYANSPFANPADPAWLGTSNQIKMQDVSVADGQIATFTFTVKGPLRQIDNYQMQFTPVLDGAKIFPYIGVNWTISTPTPVFSYTVTASSGITGNLPTSYTDPVTYTIQNTGNIVWYNEATKPSGAYSLRLLTANSFYHTSAFYDSGSWLAANQIGMSTTKVLPGGSASFSFNLKTPAANGTYSDSFGLVLDGAAIYPDTTQMRLSTVVSDYSFTVTSNNLPDTLLAGQKYSGKIILHNSGAATWYSDGNTPVNTHAVRLMMAGYRQNLLADMSDTSWLGNGNQIKMLTTSVAPGSDGEFDFNIIAPYNLSSYNNDFRLVLDGVYIVPTLIQKNISFPAKTYSYGVAPNGIGPTNTMSPGQIIPSKLFIKNNTNFVWYSDSAKPTSLVAGAFRVVMNFPWYRSSVFADSADPSWIGNGSQIKMVTPEVDPGGIGEFDFNWKAPLLVGYYREHFSLALDGYSVLPDIGMEIDVTVR